MAAIFIHHRDLRQVDNLGLEAACASYSKVYPIFIYTHEQIKQNSYFNPRSISFMTQCLQEITVTVFEASRPYADEILHLLQRLKRELGAAAVYENRDFSPFARHRQDVTSKAAKKCGLEYHLCEDCTLLPMGRFLKKNQEPYIKFTPFYEMARKVHVPEPSRKKLTLARAGPSKIPTQYIKKIAITAGRQAGLKIIAHLADFSKYAKTRDFPKLSTTRLSAHLHFGTVSPREVYHALKKLHNTEIIRQLYWREFYMYITEYVNTDYSKRAATRADVAWSHNMANFSKWCEGRTGVPIVDAAMRELNQTGYMHNRCRMIVAMFLIFNLHIHWKEGERYFAQNLIDYSYSNNFGGWVWCAGTETYSNDYFRAFSMEQQSKRFDPDAEYIKKWLPELKTASPKDIHTCRATQPIVDLKKSRLEGIQMIAKKRT